MNWHVIHLTACLELGLAAGYALCWAHKWLSDVRAMVAGWVQAMKTTGGR